MAITVEQINARLDEISTEVNKLNKSISDHTNEYQQLIGYRAALNDISGTEESTLPPPNSTLLTEEK